MTIIKASRMMKTPTVCNILMILVTCYWQSRVIGMASNFGEGLPSLITRGTYYQVGYEVGHAFQNQIHDYYKAHPFLRPVWLPWSETPQGQKVVKSLLNAATTHFPQYVKELRGMAKGANISFNEMFLANHYVELGAILSNSSTDDCSDLLVNHPEKSCVVIAHNEDNTPLILNRAYLLTATIVMDNNASQVLEHFTAYCYPGQLPGNAFGFNNHGLVQTVNGLYPKLVITNRVGRAFITRAMLAAEDITKAVSCAEDSAAYGLSANIGVLPRKSGEAPKVYNLELAPNPSGSKSQLSLIEVPVNSSTFHVNMYRRIHIEQLPSHVTSSVHRTKRITEFPEPKTFQQIYQILGDNKDTKYPIFRRPIPTDEEYTLATAIFDLTRGTLAIYMDNPKTSPGPVNVFQLPNFQATWKDKSKPGNLNKSLL